MKTRRRWNANQYIANLNPVVVKHEVDERGVVGVLVNTSKGKRAMGFWIDFWTWKDGELEYDWNQYIFALWNDNECMREQMQDNIRFFELMTSAAIAYIEENNLMERK